MVDFRGRPAAEAAIQVVHAECVLSPKGFYQLVEQLLIQGSRAVIARCSGCGAEITAAITGSPDASERPDGGQGRASVTDS